MKHAFRTWPWLFLLGLLSSCATSYDISDKYAGVIGKQFRTKSDRYVWRLPRHQYDFIPYSISGGYQATRLDFLPAGTVITVKAAKRSYKGGDWDLIIAEVRAPESGRVYEFEEILGFSTVMPTAVAMRWDPVDKTDPFIPRVVESAPAFHSPNGRFSIKEAAFPSPISTWSVSEVQNPSSVSFGLRDGSLIRIDCCMPPKQYLPEWVAKSTATYLNDRVLDGVIAFVSANTDGLTEFKLLARHSTVKIPETGSAAIFRMHLSRGPYAGINYCGFLTFDHNFDLFVVYYQTNAIFPDEKTATNTVFQRILKLKQEMVFHPRPAK